MTPGQRLANEKYAATEKGKAARKRATKKWNAAHREELAAKRKLRYDTDPEYRARKIALASADVRKRKRRAMDAYGGKCSCCGEAELAFLTIDHIDGNGAEHRREIKNRGGGTFYAWLHSHGYPDGFQVLCANCNLGRHINGGICPHLI
jgi:hypothetical protein